MSNSKDRFFNVIALLDCPTARNFVAVPFIEQRWGKLHVRGGTQYAREQLETADVKDLIKHGDALEVGRQFNMPTPLAKPLVLFVGDDFIHGSNILNIPVADTVRGIIDMSQVQFIEDGYILLAEDITCQYVLDLWLEKAARLAFHDNDPNAARLMMQSQPRKIVSRAAMWFTRPSVHLGTLPPSTRR